MKAIVRIGIALSLASLATPLSAQTLSFGLRGTGGVPTGSFAEPSTSSSATLIQGAKEGFGYGAEVGLAFGPIGAYASFDHIAFDCDAAACGSDGEYTLQGVTAGVKLSPSFTSQVRPFLKGGITLNNLKGGYGGSSSGVTTDRNAGYEIGAGVDFGLLGLLAVSPQIRFVGQNLKAKIPAVTNTSTTPNSGVNYFTFDLGLSVHTPFGGL
jgi:opacity protein-like surface antigen